MYRFNAGSLLVRIELFFRKLALSSSYVCNEDGMNGTGTAFYLAKKGPG